MCQLYKLLPINPESVFTVCIHLHISKARELPNELDFHKYHISCVDAHANRLRRN